MGRYYENVRFCLIPSPEGSPHKLLFRGRLAEQREAQHGYECLTIAGLRVAQHQPTLVIYDILALIRPIGHLLPKVEGETR